MDTPEVLVGFAATDFLTVQRLQLLRQHFGSLEAAWKTGSIKELQAAGISAKSAGRFLEKKQAVDIGQALKKMEKGNARIVSWDDEEYPEKLREIASPPPLFFVRGELQPQDELSVAIVGTRRISPVGRKITETMVPDLVRAGLVIVSGLARGVDAVAHKATLAAQGRTIAVLGNGIDSVYPAENSTLADRIVAEGGAIISEFAPGVGPNAFHFPRRNRIVAGLSLGTIVIEGAEKSGSLITASFALEQGREVFAVPGNPFAPMSSGPNRLVQRGEAKLILNAADVLQELPINQIDLHQQAKRILPKDPVEQTVFSLLEEEPCAFDELIRKGELSAAQFSATLTILEMKGFAVHLGGNLWAKR